MQPSNILTIAALLAIATWYLMKYCNYIEPVEEVKEPGEVAGMSVGVNGNLISCSMVSDYDYLIKRIDECKSKEHVQDINVMLEYFKTTWGKNETYEELKAEVIGLEVTMFDK
jgi:hypothetical protein